jgi:hypothetical protein
VLSGAGAKDFFTIMNSRDTTCLAEKPMKAEHPSGDEMSMMRFLEICTFQRLLASNYHAMA